MCARAAVHAATPTHKRKCQTRPITSPPHPDTPKTAPPTVPASSLSYILKSLRILKALSLLLPILALMRSRIVEIILARRFLLGVGGSALSERELPVHSRSGGLVAA